MPSTLVVTLGAVLWTCATFVGAHVPEPAVSLPQVPTARTQNGTYYGARNSRYYIDQFLGIPFAQPPTGDLRLQHPQSLNTSWDGERNATEYGYACVGYGEDSTVTTGNYTNEDCLTLNVVRPAGYDETASLPVAVWIYGGGFFAGSTIDQRYNLTFMVDESRRMGKPIIGVSLNYRLAAYGWLYSEEIVKAGLANLGLRDLRMGLHWVQENIGGFGGDPSKVTIFGESAGGLAVGALLLPYNGRDDGLFRAAICESGSPLGLGIALTRKDDSEDLYQNFTARAGCHDAQDRLACLRSLPAEKFRYLASGENTDWVAKDAYSKSFGLLYGPQADGDILLREPFEQFQDGQFVKVPFMAGDTSDEGTAITTQGYNTEQQVINLLSTMRLSNETIQEILNVYPYDNDEELGIQNHPGLFNDTIGIRYKQVATILGDLTFIVPRKIAVEAMARHSDQPIYAYRWDTMISGMPEHYGVVHFSEVPFVFHSVAGTGWVGIDTEEDSPYLGQNPFEGMGEAYLDLADLASRSWVAFIHDLDPNSYTHSGAVWPQYTLTNKTQMVFNAYNGTHAEDLFEKRSTATHYMMDKFYPSIYADKARYGW